MTRLATAFSSAVLVLALILCGCTAGEGGSPSTPAASQEATKLTAREAYDLALGAAESEYGAVYLDELTAGGGTVGLSSLYEKVDDAGQAANWEVIFNQPGNGTYLIIIVDIADGEVTSTYAGDPNELTGGWDNHVKYSLVDIDRCQISGAEAVRIADENGGSDLTRIMLRLVNGSAGCPHWIVAYGPGTREPGEHEGMFFHIDGETGEIVSTSTKTYHVF